MFFLGMLASLLPVTGVCRHVPAAPVDEGTKSYKQCKAMLRSADLHFSNNVTPVIKPLISDSSWNQP